MHSLLLALTDDDVARACGSATFQRGVPYVSAVRSVLEVEVPEGLQVSGIVPGGGDYRVTVTLSRRPLGVGFLGECSCPVARNCKHCVALALAVMPSEPHPQEWDQPEADWARTLRLLAEELDADALGPAPGRNALALQVDLRIPLLTHRWQRVSGPEASVRPLQMGKRGRWIRTGATWRDLDGPWTSGQFDPGQSAALLRIAASLQGYDPGGEWPLRTAGPALWPALAEAREAGVELVPSGSLVALELEDEPTEMQLEAAPDPSGRVAVSLGVRVAGEFVPADRLIPIGRRTHGVLALARDAEDRFTGRLVRLRRPLSDRLSANLAQGLRVEVPARDRDLLERDVLPGLARTVLITGPDGGPVVDPPAPPVVTAHVTWSGADRAVLEFGFRYPGPERFADVPAERWDDTPWATLDAPPRDARAEARALAEVSDHPAALAVLPELGAGLPAARELVGAAAWDLATRVLPALREAIEVVEHGEIPTFRLLEGEPELTFTPVGEVAADQAPSGFVAETDWLDLEITITVDGSHVPVGSVLAALTLGEPVVVLATGAYVGAEHPAFARLAALVTAAGELSGRRRRTPAEQGVLRVGTHDLGTLAEADQIGEVGRGALRWLEAARALTAVGELPAVEPVGVVTPLRDYQRQGFAWLHYLWSAGLGGILADDMGLGKTLQCLALVATARAAGAGPFLVVAPSSVVSAWQKQAATHAPGLVVRAETSRATGDLERDLAGVDVLVTTYTIARLDAARYRSREWGGVILDEAQTVKNTAAKTYQAVRAFVAPFRLAVTGTPFENRLTELWALLSITAPGLYPQASLFRDVVVHPIERDGDEKALATLRRRLRPFLLRRTKELVAADLPPKQEEVLEVDLSPAHRKAYDTVLQRERQSVMGLVEDFDGNRVAIFAAITRMRLMSLDPALADPEYDGIGSAKVDELVARLEEAAAEGHRALVFSQFTSYLRVIRDALDAAGLPWVYLDGATTNRGAKVEEFTEGTAPVFLISLKAGGTGLTLTEADYVFVMDPWWNPAVEAQAVDRAHRIGQTRPVMVYRLVATDTIEGKVMALKERKAALFDQVIGAGTATPAGLSEADIRDLFALP